MQELENTLHNHISANPSLKAGFADVYLFNELFYSYYYLNTHQPQQAYEHLVKSKEYLDENTYFMYKVLYFDTFAKYYQAIGAYQQASDYIDTTLTMLKKDFTSDYAEQLLEKLPEYGNRQGKAEKPSPCMSRHLPSKTRQPLYSQTIRWHRYKANTISKKQNWIKKGKTTGSSSPI